MKLSQLQLKAFFLAARAAASDLGEDPEAYRKRVLREELGVGHMADVGRTGDFDKIMRRVWVDRGDYARALDYSGGDIKRLRHLALEAAGKIVEQNVVKYVASVMIQMRLSTLDRDALAFKLLRPDGWDDFTERDLRKVVAALNAHIRRRD